VQIAVGSERLWSRFAAFAGLNPADPAFASNASRVENHPRLVADIEEHFAGHKMEDLLAAMKAAGIPAGKVQTINEVYEWEQTRSQGLVVGVEHPTLGAIELPGPPLRFFEPAGAETTKRAHTAPPLLGKHDSTVTQWLDQTADA
jgi:crotonobetainyl-CoA:carnitine CoA-transferase CaiB-like acyl-CoA transferase